MIQHTIKVLSKGLKNAAREVVRAQQAGEFYQAEAMARKTYLFFWLCGFTQGVSNALLELRRTAITHPTFDSETKACVRFKSSDQCRSVLLVEVTKPDQQGMPVEITSTLSYAEAQTVVTALNILRGVGAYTLTDAQADGFIREASSLNGPGKRKSTRGSEAQQPFALL